ncbi:MAG TPA: mechanosensitive ion channel domain-containing protein [Geobacteraceae bacterium]|nr:mechanosensitive ion channel domain-containing protein [Geobacteraceae bacterium]
MNTMFLRMILATAFLFCAMACNADSADKVQTEAIVIKAGAPVQVLNRTVAVLRAPFMGVPAAERALRAEDVISRLLSKQGKGDVSFQSVPPNYAILIDGVTAFFLIPEDIDPLQQETPQQAAMNAATVLRQVVHETTEARTISSILRAIGLMLAATLVLLVVVWSLNRTRTWLVERLARVAHAYSVKFSPGGESIIHRDRIISLINQAILLFFRLIIAFLLFNWLSYVLSLFPYTRPWGEQLTQYLLDGFGAVGRKALHTIPDLIVAALIFYGAHLLTSIIGGIFDRVEQHAISFAGLDRDTVRPTRRLVSIAIWLFALVMAYPYLPGSHTEAFKGLSVLVGLMVSLGASSVVGQATSGLILMYTRALRPGEYVKIADSEGTVTEVGLFSTRVRTGLGEELSLPNAFILGNITRNHSRAVEGTGFIVSATVTIGYDTPWRQVHAMLIEAAHRTGGVLSDPPPHVFQTALSDFYPQYRLVCQAIPEGARSRAEVMGALHANIQDLFNEYGVQIMSPHYFSDPSQPKVVPPDKWAPPPVKSKEEEHGI